MKLLGKDKLASFIRKHADARKWLQNWIADVEESIWKSPSDIKLTYASASFLSENVVIFNVKGNTYRLETSVAYQTEIVLVIWIGNHAEYDRRHK